MLAGGGEAPVPGLRAHAAEETLPTSGAFTLTWTTQLRLRISRRRSERAPVLPMLLNRRRAESVRPSAWFSFSVVPTLRQPPLYEPRTGPSAAGLGNSFLLLSLSFCRCAGL